MSGVVVQPAFGFLNLRGNDRGTAQSFDKAAYQDVVRQCQLLKPGVGGNLADTCGAADQRFFEAVGNCCVFLLDCLLGTILNHLQNPVGDSHARFTQWPV